MELGINNDLIDEIEQENMFKVYINVTFSYETTRGLLKDLYTSIEIIDKIKEKLSDDEYLSITDILKNFYEICNDSRERLIEKYGVDI
jgi:hypothetical protein